MFSLVVPSDKMQAGRLRKALEKQYNFNGTICSLGARIIAMHPIRRSHYIRHYATKKRNGCYARLTNPKHEYTIWYLGPGIRESGIDVPKIVFDALPHLPTRHTEEAIIEEPRRRGSLVHLSPF